MSDTLQNRMICAESHLFAYACERQTARQTQRAVKALGFELSLRGDSASVLAFDHITNQTVQLDF